MIKKILIILFCFSLFGCGGFSIRTGIKFEKPINSKTNIIGNPKRTNDIIILNNKNIVNFYRPMGNCGTGISFFVVIAIPIPIKLYINNCNQQLEFNSSSDKIAKLQLKYNNVIIEPINVITYKIESDLFKSVGNNTKYIFNINKNFREFKYANNKTLIITTKDGFIQELPIKWGIIWHNDWSII